MIFLKYFLAIFPVVSFADVIFVSPIFGCSSSCSPSPYDNLWAALQYVPSNNFLDIRMLTASGYDHFMFYKEYDPGSTTIHTSLPSTFVANYNISIKPLYCFDPEAVNFPSNCTNFGTVTVFVKDENFSLTVQGYSLNLENIEFSWLEDIWKYNSITASLSNLEDCIYHRIFCCQQGIATSIVYPSLYCTNSGSPEANLQNIFLIVQESGVFPSIMGIQNCVFKNLDFRFTKALFGFDSLYELNFEAASFYDFDVTSLVSDVSSAANWANTKMVFKGIQIFQSSSWYNKLSINIIDIPTSVNFGISFSNCAFQNFTVLNSVPLFTSPYNAQYEISILVSEFYNITIATGSALMVVTGSSKLDITSATFESIKFAKYTSMITAHNSSAINLNNIQLPNYILSPSASNTENMEFFYFDSLSSISAINFDISQLLIEACATCMIFNGNGYLSFNLENTLFQETNITNSGLIASLSDSAGPNTFINITLLQGEFNSQQELNTVFLLSSVDQFTIEGFNLIKSNLSGVISLVTASSKTSGSYYLVAGLSIALNNFTQGLFQTSPSALFQFNQPGNIILTNFNFEGCFIEFFQKFIQIVSSNNVTISNFSCNNNIFYPKQLPTLTINSEFLRIVSSTIDSSSGININNNYFNAELDFNSEVFGILHFYAIISLYNSNTTKLTNLTSKNNNMDSSYRVYYNIEFLALFQGEHKLENILVSDTSFAGTSFFYTTNAILNLTNFELIQTVGSGYLNLFTSNSLVYIQSYIAFRNKLSTINLIRQSTLNISNSLFNNNEIGYFISFHQSKGYGLLGLLQNSVVNFINSECLNEILQSGWVYNLYDGSTIYQSNIVYANFLIQQEGVIFKADSNPKGYFNNITFQNNTRDSSERYNLFPKWRFLVYLSQISGSATNINFINSEVLWIFTQANFNIQNFTIANIDYNTFNTYSKPSLIPILFYNYESTLTFENGIVSNLQGETSDYLFQSFSGTMSLTNVTISNINQVKGNLFFSQDGTTNFNNLNVINVTFQLNPLFNFFGISAVATIQNSEFINTSSVLKFRQGKSLSFNTINITTMNQKKLNYLIQIISGGSINLTNTEITLLKSNFLTYVINLEENLYIFISQLQISNSNSSYGPLRIKNSKNPLNADFENIQLTSNIGYYLGSGGIYLDNIKSGSFLCSHCTFLNNIAYGTLKNGGRGGAVALYTQKTSNEVGLTFYECEFNNNEASIHGGAIYVYGEAPTMDQCSFSGNIPNNMGSIAVSLQALSDVQVPNENTNLKSYSNTEVVFTNAPITQPLSNKYAVVLVDRYGGIALDNSEAILYINTQDPQETLNSSVSSIKAQNGEFQFKDILLYAKGGTQGWAYMYTTPFLNFTNIAALNNLSPNFTLSVFFKDCFTGQTYNPSTGTCTDCPYGLTQMSDIPNYQGECTPCDSSMICEGGAEFGPAAGYWMMNSTADLVFPCPEPAACIGGILPSGCAQGYEGNLCDDCIPGYGKRSGGLGCHECSTYITLYLELGFKILFLILLVITFFKIMSYKGQMGVLRTLISYLQLRSLMGSIIITWPPSVQVITNLLEVIASSQEDYFGIDCFFSQLTPEDKYFRELVIFTIMPWIIILLSSIAITLIYLTNGKSLREIKQALAAACGFIIFLFYPSVSKTILGLYSCSNLYRDNNQIEYLNNHYDIECWTTQHMSYAVSFGVVFWIIWVAAIPLGTYYLLKHYHSDRSDLNSFLSIVVIGYRQSKLSWEIVNIMLKLLAISLLIFGMKLYPSFQIFAIMYFFFLCYALNKKAKPGITRNVNTIDRHMYIILGVVALCGIFYNIAQVVTSGGIIFIVIVYFADLLFLSNVALYFLNKQVFWRKLLKKLQTKSTFLYELLNNKSSIQGYKLHTGKTD